MKTVMPSVFDVKAHDYVAITNNDSCSEVLVSNLGVLIQAL